MPLRFSSGVFLLVFIAPLVAFAADTPTTPITSAQIVERIKVKSAIPWSPVTVDTFKAGNPEAPVKGIAVAMMATYDVLKRAAAAGATLVITHEPTFYGHQDVTTNLERENDAVFAAKQDLIKTHGLVIWRFHDHLHRIQPDPVITGVTRLLGWEKFQSAPGASTYVVPEITVEALAGQIRDKLQIRALRFVGDPAMKVTKIGFSPGASGFGAHRTKLQSDAVEVLLLGEGTEWETIEYGVDAFAEGKRKALILLGHIPSEEAGMIECAAWLKTFITEVPIQFFKTPEPFSVPK